MIWPFGREMSCNGTKKIRLIAILTPHHQGDEVMEQTKVGI